MHVLSSELSKWKQHPCAVFRLKYFEKRIHVLYSDLSKCKEKNIHVLSSGLNKWKKTSMCFLQN
jgi:hypothetical protein